MNINFSGDVFLKREYFVVHVVKPYFCVILEMPSEFWWHSCWVLLNFSWDVPTDAPVNSSYFCLCKLVARLWCDDMWCSQLFAVQERGFLVTKPRMATSSLFIGVSLIAFTWSPYLPPFNPISVYRYSTTVDDRVSPDSTQKSSSQFGANCDRTCAGVQP